MSEVPRSGECRDVLHEANLNPDLLAPEESGCYCPEELASVLHRALEQRRTRVGAEGLTATGMEQNLQSSHSHAIITLSVSYTDGTNGQLTLVDLAGSEVGIPPPPEDSSATPCVQAVDVSQRKQRMAFGKSLRM